MRHRWKGKVVIRREDIKKIHDYARANCGLRDFLLFRLPMKIGLRTNEIATLRIENIDFESRSFHVLDSKQKELYPLPLDMLTLQLIQDLVVDRTEGYVFRQKTSWKYTKGDKPLTKSRIWQIIHGIAAAAGVSNFNPRMLRHYFAVNWARIEKKSIVGLQEILRHADLTNTQVYIQRLSVWEDLQKEYDAVQNEPFTEFHQAISDKSLNPNYQKWCSKCDHEPICKFLPEFCSSKCAATCKYFVLAEEFKQKAVIAKALRNSQDNKVSGFQTA